MLLPPWTTIPPLSIRETVPGEEYGGNGPITGTKNMYCLADPNFPACGSSQSNACVLYPSKTHSVRIASALLKTYGTSDGFYSAQLIDG
jgi:hypothetical protein